MKNSTSLTPTVPESATETSTPVVEDQRQNALESTFGRLLDKPWPWAIMVPLLPLAGYLISGYLPRLVLYTLYTLALLAVSYFDLREQRVPNRISYPSILFALGAMFHSPGWKSALLGGMVAAAVLFIPVLVYGAERAGIGDVKLALLIGLILGWSVALFWAALLAFVLAAIVSLIGILLQRLTFKSKLPFGPFMALGAIVAMFTMA